MTVYSWGRGEDGQLGLGDTSDQHRPVLVDALQERRIVQIACGSGHTVVLTEEGEVYTWGRGDDGRLGHGDNGWKFVPRLVEELRGKSIRQVTCGSYHTAAVTVSGDLYTWGGGMYGKLGHGNDTGHSTPCLVDTLKGLHVRQVACGSRHTVVLLENKDVYTWGDKENGVSGHGTTDGHQYLPCAVKELRGKSIKQISACGFHTAALTESGDVYTFGEGKFGRLGHHSEHNQLYARTVDALVGKRVKQVACGGFHTAAVTESGEVYTWGGGEHGQLGHGDKVNKTVPTLVESLKDKMVVQITCGWSHTVALTDDGEVYTWGNGDHGKLGHNDTNKVTLPRMVEVLENKRVVSVASYNEHTVALVDPSALVRTMMLTSSYVNDMRQLIDNADFSDVTFLIDGRAVHSHRAILAARSDHFRAMFSSGMRESREHEIRLQHMRVPVFLALLEYIYVDSVDVGAEMALELYAAADLYTLDRLKDMCEVIVQKTIDVDNAAMLLQSADEFQTTRVREICLVFIVRNFDAVTKSDGFANLSRDLILDVLQSRAIQCLEVMQQESEDTDATLDALLSFLDECEPEEAADVDAQVPVQDTMRRASKRSRGFKPNRARDARRFELIHLRETVRSLESELEDLQARECSRQISAGSTHRTSDTSRSSASVPALVSVLSAWEGIASRQLEERQRAELENIRLKDFLAQQVKVAKALQKLIHKRTAWESILKGSHRHALMRTTMDNNAARFQDVIECAERELANIDPIMEDTGLSQAQPPFSHSSLNVDETGSVVLEVVDTKLLPFDVKATGRAVWRHFAHAMEVLPHRVYYPQHVETTSDTVMEQFDLETEHGSVKARYHVQQVLRKHEDEDRVLIAWRCAMEMVSFNGEPTMGILLPEDGYVVIKPAQQSADSTVMQLCYIIKPDIYMHNVNRIGTLTDFILSAVARTIKASHQLIENFLLDQTVRGGLSARMEPHPCSM